MHTLRVSVGIGLLLLASPRAELPIAAPNVNTSSGGVLRDGVFTMALEARRTMWHPDGDSLPGRETARIPPVRAQVSPSIVKQIDHVMILTRDRERLVRLLVDTLQLPMVWGQPGSAFTATTGIALGDINLELVPREDAVDARLTSLALQPVHLGTVCDDLTARGLVLREPDICAQDPGQRRWTVVGFRHAFEGTNYFLIQYLAFDMDVRRAQFRSLLQQRQGGPLGVRRVTEFRLVYGSDQLAAAVNSWRRLLGPPLPARQHYFALGAGPGIALSTADSVGASIVVEVESLSRASVTARSLRLLEATFPDSLVLDPKRFGGLRLILVNR